MNKYQKALGVYEKCFDKIFLDKAVWCKTEELANEFLALTASFGYKWFSGKKLTDNNYWQQYKENTCYHYSQFFGDTGLTYCDKDYFIDSKIEVVEFKSLKKHCS